MVPVLASPKHERRALGHNHRHYNLQFNLGEREIQYKPRQQRYNTLLFATTPESTALSLARRLRRSLVLSRFPPFLLLLSELHQAVNDSCISEEAFLSAPGACYNRGTVPFFG